MIEIAGIGVLLEGPAGSGKTSLSLGLLEHALLRGIEGNLVSDDQAFLSNKSGKLIAEAPEALRGKVEIRGLGLIDINYRPSTQVHLVAKLVEAGQVERMPEPQSACLLNVELPLILLPRCHELMARRIVFGWIDSSP